MSNFSAEERQLLADSLDGFLSRNYGFERWMQKRDAAAPNSGQADWQSFAEQGWLGVALPEDMGGVGGGAVELAIVMAAAGRHMVLEDLLGPIVLGAGAIDLAGSAQQRATLLPKIADGSLRLGFCHTEPDAGFDRGFVRTVAHGDETGFVLNGTKGFTIGASSADMLVVSARLNAPDGRLQLFLVSRDAEGVTLNDAPALDGRMGATVSLNGVQIAKDAALTGNEADMFSTVERIIDRGALATCAEACGAMAAATESTIAYLKVRSQFGQTLSKFQVLQHRAVDMRLACEEARALTHAALVAMDRGAEDAQKLVWQAKVQTAQSARFVGGRRFSYTAAWA